MPGSSWFLHSEEPALRWQSGKLPGRANRVIAWDTVIGGVLFVHVTDDGPDATPGERWWCEYEIKTDGSQQACMAGTLAEMFANAGADVDAETIAAMEASPDAE